MITTLLRTKFEFFQNVFLRNLKIGMLFLCLSSMLSVKAQVSAYTMSSATIASYSPLTVAGGASEISWTNPVPAPSATLNWDNHNSSIVPIGFNFNYNGTVYTTVNVSPNGFITFGSTAPSVTNYNPIASSEGYSGAISVYGANLRNNNVSIKYKTDLILRTLTIEYVGLRVNATGTSIAGTLNMQIVLNESGLIDMIYKPTTAPNTLNALTVMYGQIGLRGTANSDFLALNLPTAATLVWPVPPATIPLATANNATVATKSACISVPTKFTFAPPTCIAPSGVTALPLTITHNSATISWTASTNHTPNPAASNYQLYYSTTATAPTGATAPLFTGITGTTYNLTGLAPNQIYYVYVRSNCGSTGAWSVAGIFTTRCTPFIDPYVSGAPYEQDFEDSTPPYLPPCNTTENLVTPLPPYTGSPYASYWVNSDPTTPDWGFNTKHMRCTVLGGQNNNAYYYTEGISLTAGVTYRLEYTYGSSTQFLAIEQKMKVYVGNSPTQLAMTTTLVDHPSIKGGPFLNVVDFTPATSGTYYFGFQDYTPFTTGGTTLLDNVYLNVESCRPPTDILISGVTFSAATLNWTASPSSPANGYQYYVSSSSTPPSYGFPPTGSTAAGITTANVNGLTSSTTYYVWVRSNCNGLYSVWTPIPATFTTLVQPAATVVNLTTVNNNRQFTTCTATSGSAIFFDSGSAAANYADNESQYTVVFKPGIAGAKIKAAFSSFETESGWDGLSIYNGNLIVNPTTTPLISSGLAAGFNATTCPAGSFYGTNSPGTIFSSAADGSLTFVFSSDFIITRPGWAATITCETVPTITSFTPANNNCQTGTLITLTGTNFVNITSVTIGGVPAVYNVVNSTTIQATLPATATSGPIVVSSATATGRSLTNFTVLAPPPTGVLGSTICPGNPASLTSTTNCSGYVNPTLSISGSWAATDPIAPRQNGSANSPSCSYSATNVGYTRVDFQVSQTGLYTFEMVQNGSYDGMGYITSGAFVAGTCAFGTYIVGDDDSAGGLEPRMSAILTVGVTYTLYSTTYNNYAPNYYSYAWTITPPAGGTALLYGISPIEWYTSATGGTAVGSGSPFNPVGVAGAGVDGITPGNYTFYGACSSNPTCRTSAVVSVINRPSFTLPANANICPNASVLLQIPTTAAGTTYTWASNVSGTLFTNPACTIPYVAGTSASSVYLYTPATATITVTGTNTASGCSTVVTTTQTVLPAKTFNGSAWSGNALPPTASEGIVINGTGNFTLGNVTGCSCTVTSGNLTITAGSTMTLTDKLTVTAGGTLTFENGASLLQVNNVTNTGNITYKRNTTGMLRYDYTYWSSPVQPQTLFALSPNTLSDKYFWWNTAIYNWNSVAAPGITLMDPGRGYIIRAPQSFNISGATTIYNAQFIGVPNNGNYSVAINVSGANNLNLIGNPYPSAINADLFMSGNATTLGTGSTIYLWTHNSPFASNVYVANDYAVYNYTGGTGTRAAINPGINTSIPSGKIAAGQSFFIKGTVTGTALFTNAMRVSGNNTQFYRNNNSIDNEPLTSPFSTLEKNRVWLELKNNQGAYKQILVGYIDQATNAFDDGFDGEILEAGNSVSFYSELDTKKLSIQGKALPFAETDQIPLGFHIEVPGIYEVALAQFDGLFESQAVYLEDLATQTTHDLRNSAYQFSAEAGTFDTRFVLRFQNALNTDVPVITANDIIAYKDKASIHVVSSKAAVRSVQIVDISGRVLASKSQLNANEVEFEGLHFAQQALLIQVTTHDGLVVTKKLLF
jgi:hypothetical protein